MTRVSAIPEHLSRYSDTCTQGAEQLQTWVRRVLTPALLAYENGDGPCSSGAIDANVARQVAAAYYTDRDVKTVGLAFLRAGGVLVRGRNQPIFSNNKAIDKAFKQLENEAARQQAEAAHRVQINAGAALAKRLMHAKPIEVTGIVRELARHSSDPYFSAGFYNNLDERHIETAMAQGGIPALVSAYASGVLDKKVYEAVNTRLARPIPEVRFAVSLDDHYMTAAQKLQFLDGIAADQTAARNFANSLSQSDLRALFEGPMSRDPSWPNKLNGVLASGIPTWPGGAQPPSSSTDLSYELWFAGHLPYPSVDPDGSKYSRDQDAVLSWIELNRNTIFQEAQRRNIDPKAIVAAIAWEGMVNNWQPFPSPIPPNVPAPLGRHAIGPGKVHIDTAVVKQIEDRGYLPRRGLFEREAKLATPEGSIQYIAAIMGAYADVADKEGRHGNIRNRPEILSDLFQGSDLETWQRHLKRKPPGEGFTPGNDMGKWTAKNGGFLNDALRLWEGQQSTSPPATRMPGTSPNPPLW
ncbi:hypothetical protein ACFWMG_05370 [Streptomyces sp. NPDC127074]|uniref:hypothetical protein n=1 Tax=Streptomyces sp. NPDC127074 TaxID=3347130 RepID=UPI00364984DF